MKYYLHDSNAFNDEKITLLYMNFGYEGLGLFYTLLEKLALQEKPVLTSVLKRQLNIGKKLEKCWNFMEEIGLIHSSNGETFNKQLLNFSEKYQIKKEKNAKRISEWRKNQEDTEKVTHYESVRNTPKVKESKVKESKYINITLPFSSDEFKTAWSDWKEYKAKEHRFRYKSEKTELAALNELVKISGDSEQTAIEIIQHSIANGYKGLFPQKATLNKAPPQQKKSVYQQNQEAYEGALEMFRKSKQIKDEPATQYLPMPD